MQLLVGVMDDIQKHYESTVADDARLWTEGQIAVSQFTDDNLFYRARVMNVIDADTVEVCASPSHGILTRDNVSTIIKLCHQRFDTVGWAVEQHRASVRRYTGSKV